MSMMSINENDIDTAGYRGVDIANLTQKKFKTPHAFIVPCSLFNSFLDQSGIRERLDRIYQKHPQTAEGYKKAYEDIKELFFKVSFSQKLNDELLDAYESLGISINARNVSSQTKSPQVTLIPSYTYEYQPLGGVYTNITTPASFLDTIKLCWLSVFLPDSVSLRKEKGIEEYSVAIIIQTQTKGSITVHGNYTSTQTPAISVYSYTGLLDTTGEVTKDVFHISHEHLQIMQKHLDHQRTAYVPKTPFGSELSSFFNSKKIMDKQLLEVARLTKRVHIALKKDCEVFFSVDKDDVYILFTNSHEKTQLHQQLAEPIAVTEQPLLNNPYTDQKPLENEPFAINYGQETNQNHLQPPQIPTPHNLQNNPIEQSTSQDHTHNNQHEQEPVFSHGKQHHNAQQNEHKNVNDHHQQAHINMHQDHTQANHQKQHAQTQNAHEPDHSISPINQNTQASTLKDDSIFSLYQSSQAQKHIDMSDATSTASSFVLDSYNKLKEYVFNKCKQTHGIHPSSFDQAVSLLHQNNALPLSREDVFSLHNDLQHINEGYEPSNSAIGIAWRVKNLFSTHNTQ